MIRLRGIHHAALRVRDVAEAAPRWCVQFGLTETERRAGRALLRCTYEAYSLELVEGGAPGHDHTGFELARDVSLADASESLRGHGVEHREHDGALHLADPDGNGIELVPYRPPAAEARFPDVARATTALPGFHPRRLGHVNVLAERIADMHGFYTDVLGMRLTDRLGAAGSWYHVNADHHVVAVVDKQPKHFHHLAFELVDWGELRVALDHLGQHGRWLGWGPVRHGIGRNLCAYVRIPEEHLFVELYCDMEQLRPDHEPRDWPDDAHSSNTWGILPPRSYFRFDEEAVRSERLQLEAQGTPLP